MSAFVISSRFAGLKIEDDDSPPTTLQQKAKKQEKTQAKLLDNSKKTKNQPTTSKSQTSLSSKKKKKPQNVTSSKQWDQWKQKDEELVDDNFEDDLQQAILLSKLDFEENKDVYKKSKKQAEKQKSVEEETAKLKSKKIKKKNIMSLDQFNVLVNGEEVKSGESDQTDILMIPEEESDNEVPKSPVKDTKFFERVKSETKLELLKDKQIDTIKNRLSASDEVITRVQFIDALERKDKEIAGLRQELIVMKQELLTVKSRNKKLCNILGQGEMKDKAEVLIEVERLRGVQAELTAELAALHTDLEKARSMNSYDPRAKQQAKIDKKSGAKKKNTNVRFDVSSEALLSKDAGSGTAG